MLSVPNNATMSLSTKDTYSRSMPTGGETPVQVLKKEEKNEDSFFLPQAEVPVPPAQGMTIIFLSSSNRSVTVISS